MAFEWHRPLEAKWIGMTLYTTLAVIVGGIVLLIPPFFMQGTIDPIEGIRPYSALEQEGRDIYIRESCYVCHSQQVRPFKTETDRYGPFSTAGETIYDRPFQFGSRRTGPDLARIGGKYPDSWHWLHFENPRSIEPRSNMPAFEFLIRNELDLSLTAAKLETLRTLGAPYTDAEIANARENAQSEMQKVAASLRADGIAISEENARSEAIALIAYLQSLGRAIRNEPLQTPQLAQRELR